MHYLVTEVGALVKEYMEFGRANRSLVESGILDFLYDTIDAFILFAKIAGETARFVFENWGAISGALKALTFVIIALGAAVALAFAPLIIGAAIIYGIIFAIGSVVDWVSKLNFSFTELWQNIKDGTAAVFAPLKKLIGLLPGGKFLLGAGDSGEAAGQVSAPAQGKGDQTIHANDQRNITNNVTVPEGTPDDIARDIADKTGRATGAPDHEAAMAALQTWSQSGG